MANIQVKGHHKIINGKRVWVEEYFRNGKKLSDAELAEIKRSLQASSQMLVELGIISPDETVGGPSSTWDLESKQNKVSDVTTGLDASSLPPNMRLELENNIENFLQNQDPATDIILADILDKSIEQAHIRQAQNAEQAAAMLQQMRNPVTEDGRRARKMLQEIVAQKGYLDENITSFFDDAFAGERRAQRTIEIAQEVSPVAARTTEAARLATRKVRDLLEVPIEESYPKMRRVLEEVEQGVRQVAARCEHDPQLSRATEDNLREAKSMMRTLSDEFGMVHRSYSNGAKANEVHVESMYRTLRRLTESLESLEHSTRRVANNFT